MKFFGLPERTPIGIDVGTKNIKAVQMSHGPRGWRVEATAAFARTTVDAPLSRAEVARLSDVLARRSFAGRRVVLAVPHDKLIVGTMELPARSAGISLDAAARTEFSRAYKCEPNTFEMTYWDLPAPARAARTTNVMAAACAHEDADALIELFRANRLEVVGLDARSWAMSRACAPAVEDAAGIVILLDIGWNGALLVLLHHGIVIYERALSDGGIRNLLKTLEADLKIAADVGEFVLTHSGLLGTMPPNGDGRIESKVPEELRGEVRGGASAHFERVSQDLLASISYTSHQYPDSPVSRLLLMGGGAMIPGVVEYLQSLVGFECRVMTPLASASSAPAVARECSAALTTAAGLSQFDDR